MKHLTSQLKKLSQSIFSVEKCSLRDDNGATDTKYLKEEKTIEESGLFDGVWYLEQYPDVQSAGISPIYHYVRYGAKEGRSPFRGFDSFLYSANHPEIAARGMNPLVHFILFSYSLAPDDWRSPEHITLLRESGMFDERYYLNKYPEVKDSGLDPVIHYLYVGWREGKDPSEFFDTSFYLSNYSDSEREGVNPLLHYLLAGRQEKRICREIRESGLSLKFSDERYEEERPHPNVDSDVRCIAFYLPQFHRIPENDQWCGEGFTEWTNVRKAEPLYEGHKQPRVPHSDIGYYDLSDWRVLHEQAKLAKRHGVTGFCFYHYWFNGKRLLEKPVNDFLDHPEIEIDFCLCWANENWTRRWDGFDDDLLIGQAYTEKGDIAFIRDLSRYLRDPRYIRINGAPLILIYRTDEIPEPEATAARWRKWCRENGIGEIYLAASQAFGNDDDPRKRGFDAAFEFPPNQTEARKLDVSGSLSFRKNCDCAVFSYDRYVDSLLSGEDWHSKKPYDLFKTAMLAWDNTARRGRTGGTVYFGFSFRKFREWLARSAEITRRNLPQDRRLVFINAWNEWAEGTHLEPDERYGYKGLNSVGDMLDRLARNHQVRRDETLIFISPYISLLDEVTRWFRLHTGFNVIGIASADGSFLEVPEHIYSVNDFQRMKLADVALKKREQHFVIELNAQAGQSATSSDGLADLPRLALTVGRDCQSDLKGFTILAAIRTGFSLSPQISVIVPNYNHGAYLRRRLDSVYGQTFKDFEVILLDDASTDDSKALLTDYADKFAPITRCAYNRKNSGNVFRQWKNGIESATAKLIWIAESDDFAELDMLEVLLPCFDDETVRLAYCYPLFVDGMGAPRFASTADYFRQGASGRWDAPYVETSHNEVNDVLGAINTIPNVSSVVFRKPEDTAFMNEAAEYSLCGDWFFYLELIRGWKIVFTNETRSYFRLQDTGVTGRTLQSPKYVQEHLTLANVIAQKYRIVPDVLRRFFDQLESVVKTAGAPANIENLSKESDLNRILSRDRYLNILLITQGFFLGGGEIFPVHLANELKRLGHNVIVLSLDVFPDNPRIRSAVSADVPVYRAEGLIHSEITFKRFLHDHGIDVINTHGHGSDLFALRYLKNLPTPWLVTMHGGYESLLSDQNAKEKPDEFRYVRQRLKEQIKRVDKWVYIAQKNLAPFRQHTEFDLRRFVKIGNGLGETFRGLISRENLGIPEDAFVMCCATRAIPEKGWREAITLATRLDARIDREVHLILLGDGPVFDELKASNTNGRIHLPGFQDNVVDYFAISDLGLLCSYFSGESFPLCIIECLSAGRPVLATDIGECRDILSVNNGEIAGAVFPLTNGRISDSTLGDMERWVIELIQNTNRQSSLRHFAEKVSAKFRIESVAQKYLNLYQQALGQTPPDDLSRSTHQ